MYCGGARDVMSPSLLRKITDVQLKHLFIQIKRFLSSHKKCCLVFQITQQLEGICLQVIGTVLHQHVLGTYQRVFLHLLACVALLDGKLIHLMQAIIFVSSLSLF